jgi:hypothetical protein
MQQMLAIHIQQPPLQHTKHLRKQLDLITYVLHIIMKTTWSSIFDRTVLKLRCNDNHWCFPSSFLDFVTIPMLPPLVSESCNYLSCENIKLRFFFSWETHLLQWQEATAKVLIPVHNDWGQSLPPLVLYCFFFNYWMKIRISLV